MIFDHQQELPSLGSGLILKIKIIFLPLFRKLMKDGPSQIHI